MNILHILSSTFFAGSVAYALALTEKQLAENHQVILISDTENLGNNVSENNLQNSLKAISYALPISKRDHIQRFINIRFIRKIIKKHQIDIIHAHSRAASWLSYFAVIGKKIPLISTIHGRQHLHASTSLFDIYGDKIIAICPNLKQHLIKEVKMKPEKITVLANGFDFDKLDKFLIKNQQKNNQDNQHKSIKIAFIGRFNGVKGEIFATILANIFPEILAKYPTIILQLIGGELEHFDEKGKKAITDLLQKHPNSIEKVGFVADVPAYICGAQLVIGAGRVAIETLYLEKPVLAVGEACYAGIIDENNLKTTPNPSLKVGEQAPLIPKASISLGLGVVLDAFLQNAINTNFGDILAENNTNYHNFEQIKTDLFIFLENLHQKNKKVTENIETPKNAIKTQIKALYSIENVHQQIMQIYRSARMKKLFPAYIPILMYHKIPEKPIESPNRIFITKENFKKHLAFFRLRGLTPITFIDYKNIAEGNIKLSQGRMPIPKKPIILTFDDGYEDNFTNLLPMMQKYDYKGVIYLLGDERITYNYWDADKGDHKDMLMNITQKQAFVLAGWEIGAHTLTHPNLTEISAQQAFEEMFLSKKNIEETLQTKIISFAYPYGSLNENLKEMAKKAGFDFAIATDTGGMHIEDDYFQIFRVNMFPQDGFFALYKKTSSWYRTYYEKRKR